MNELLPSPHITALNDKEQIQQMRSYLFQLKESLEFILTNIGTENLSDTLLKDLKNMGMSIAEVQSDVDMRQKTTVGLINESNLTVSDVINSALFAAEIQEVKDYADSVAGTVGEHDHTVSDITDFPSTMPPSEHTHKKSEVTDFAHTHTKSEISDFPTSMTPSAHNQSASTITAGTFAGQVIAPAGTDYTTARIRNAVIVSADPGEGASVSYPNGTLIFVK